MKRIARTSNSRAFGPRSLTSLLLLGLLWAVANGQAPTWQTNYAKALQLAKAQNKPVFIDFRAEWCGPCKMLERDVFATSKVQALLKNAILLRIDVDESPADAERFQVSSIPRLILLAHDGKTKKWDAIGYRDADTFASEFKEAMGIKGVPSAADSAPEPAPLAQVKAALNKGSYAQLKASDPVLAQKGLAMLVAKLGVFQEKDFKPTALLIQKAGKDAYPALVEGMNHKHLAVRVGAYRAMQLMLGNKQSRDLVYDPWASTKARQAQLGVWKRWLQSAAV